MSFIGSRGTLEDLLLVRNEEADSHIMVHGADAAQEYTSIIIRTVDSDIVVLVVYVFAQLRTSLTELWVAFGTGKKYRVISAH